MKYGSARRWQLRLPHNLPALISNSTSIIDTKIFWPSTFFQLLITSNDLSPPDNDQKPKYFLCEGSTHRGSIPMLTVGFYKPGQDILSRLSCPPLRTKGKKLNATSHSRIYKCTIEALVNPTFVWKMYNKVNLVN